jgi:hypothetical protein
MELEPGMARMELRLDVTDPPGGPGAVPELEVHQVEAGVPQQFRRLVEGRLDVGLERASLAPPEVASQLFRLDPLGVLVPGGPCWTPRCR